VHFHLASSENVEFDCFDRVRRWRLQTQRCLEWMETRNRWDVSDRRERLMCELWTFDGRLCQRDERSGHEPGLNVGRIRETRRGIVTATRDRLKMRLSRRRGRGVTMTGPRVAPARFWMATHQAPVEERRAAAQSGDQQEEDHARDRAHENHHTAVSPMIDGG